MKTEFDAGRLKRDLSDLSQLSQSFGNSLSRALARAVVDGRSLSDVMRGLALSLARQTLAQGIQSLGANLFSAIAAPRAPAQRQMPPMQVTMNIAAPDADSFRRSERQVAASALRALARGKAIL